MKSGFLYVALALVVLTSCEKTNGSDDVIITNTPRSEVPTALQGSWLNGTFSMSNWWSYDGKSYLGNPYSSSRAFTFKKNGDAEFFQVLKSFTGSCSIEAFTYMKGTVQFSSGGKSFTFYPQKGNYRGFYSCSSGNNFNRPATKDELKPSVYYWSKETDAGNHEWLVTRFDQNPNSSGTYFKPASW